MSQSRAHPYTRDVIRLLYKKRHWRVPHQYKYQRATMNTYSLGNGRSIRVCEWKGEKRVDLREWSDDKPTKKGISLTLLRWKSFLDFMSEVDKALKSDDAYRLHLGGNVYCTVKENNPCVDIRQYWKPQEDVVPTKKGLCLRPEEYQRLKDFLPKIGEALPELDTIVPCLFQSDHANQLGFLKCPECNPNDYMNW